LRHKAVSISAETRTSQTAALIVSHAGASRLIIRELSKAPAPHLALDALFAAILDFVMAKAL
jgi:broad specificity phosphatase PhoE